MKKARCNKITLVLDDGGIFMRKVLSLVMVLALTVAMATACGKKNTGTPGAEGGNKTGYELALVTDVGTINDKSFNQGSWEGLERYAKDNDKSSKYYQPAEATTASYIETIGLAVRGGAKLVVCPGYKFSEAVFDCQTTYPDVKFIILDSQPSKVVDKETDYTIKDNVYAIYYAEEQAGYLAGYAAVMDGYTKLGFMGGMALPPVVRFGYGFVQGAEQAATELGIDKIDMKYHYTGGFEATPEALTTAASWYQSGTEVIFGCGGAVGNSVMAAAQDNNGKVIGVDVDQSSESETVISSAMKLLDNSVYEGIKMFYDGNFPGGKIVTLDVTEKGVGLPMETSKFKTFSKEQYETLYSKIVSGEYKPVGDKDVTSVKELNVTRVSITVVE